MKPEMRQDERYARLSYPARELFNGLITMADDEGRFRSLSSAILGHVFPYDDDAPRRLKGWIAEIQESGMVVFYMADGVPYGAFRHWKRHQKINRPRPSELPPPPDADVAVENSTDPDAFIESSVNGHGQISDESRLMHSPTRRRAFRSDPLTVKRLNQLLADHVRANDPKAAPKPDSERWMTDMRLLLADRNDDAGEVERIIEWCQRDAFWRSNILSPGKLRKQFTQLVLRADRASPGRHAVLEHADRWQAHYPAGAA